VVARIQVRLDAARSDLDHLERQLSALPARSAMEANR